MILKQIELIIWITVVVLIIKGCKSIFLDVEPSHDEIEAQLSFVSIDRKNIDNYKTRLPKYFHLSIVRVIKLMHEILLIVIYLYCGYLAVSGILEVTENDLVNLQRAK